MTILITMFQQLVRFYRRIRFEAIYEVTGGSIGNLAHMLVWGGIGTQMNSKQKIFIEYIMLDGINDEEQHAHQLGKLLETFDVVINLIPSNPIGDLSQFRTSSESKVLSFQRILRGTYNIRISD